HGNLWIERRGEAQRLQGTPAVLGGGQTGSLGGDTRLPLAGQLQALRQVERDRRRGRLRLRAATAADSHQRQQKRKNQASGASPSGRSWAKAVGHGAASLATRLSHPCAR